MTNINQAHHYLFGSKNVNRIGYGCMQLSGPHIYGPPKDINKALAVLQAAIEQGVNHIDTSDFYGPHITNQLIKKALHPYQDDLTIVTKIGAKRGQNASWLPAFSAQELIQAVHDNLNNLGLETLDIVNFRAMFDAFSPSEGSIEEAITTLARLQEKGLINHIGLSNVTSEQISEAMTITEIVCVQNQYNLIHRNDDVLIDQLASKNIAYVPFFPLGGFSPFQSAKLSSIAETLGATPKQVALAWLLKRSPNILLIPGTSSVEHLTENMGVASIELTDDLYQILGSISANP